MISRGRKLCFLPEIREMLLTSDTMDAYIALFGLNDQNIAMIEQECSVNISLRGNCLVIQGESERLDLAEKAIRILFDMISRNEPVDRLKIRYVISMVREGNADQIEESLRRVIAITHRGKHITCKTIGQQNYIETIRKKNAYVCCRSRRHRKDLSGYGAFCYGAEE